MKKITASYKWSTDYAKISWSDTQSFESTTDIELSSAFMATVQYALNARVQLNTMFSVEQGNDAKGNPHITETEYVGLGIIAPEKMYERAVKYFGKVTDEDKNTLEYFDLESELKLLKTDIDELKEEYIEVYAELI